MARGEFEAERLDRLHRLTSVLRTWRPTETQEGKKELASLKKSVEKWSLPLGIATGLLAVTDSAAVGVATAMGAASAMGAATVMGAAATVGLPATLAYIAIRGVGKATNPSAPPSHIITYNSSGELEDVPSHEGLLSRAHPAVRPERAH